MAVIAAIAAEARVTTGAIYHHFASKKGLFRAVAEQLETEILAAAMQVDGPDTWQRLRAVFNKLIDVCAAPDIQRIIFIEAPQVIGPEEWRDVELQYAYGATRTILEQLMADGLLRLCPVDLVARAPRPARRGRGRDCAHTRRPRDQNVSRRPGRQHLRCARVPVGCRARSILLVRRLP